MRTASVLVTTAALSLATLSTSGAALSAERARLVFGQPYSCSGGAQRLIVRSCKPTYTFETCDVQYLNTYAPNSLGAQVGPEAGNA